MDSDAPLYQLFDKEIWQDFSFHERYPDRNELCRYFDHIDSKVRFSEHTEYNKDVKSARFDDGTNKWTIECADGSRARARWFIPAIGFAAKAYIPKIEGMDEFKGIMHHTAVSPSPTPSLDLILCVKLISLQQWPQEGVDLDNKRIAVIGTGASGIQVIQECSKHAKQLTSYQRTPNMCLPMCQEDLPADTDAKRKTDGVYDQAFSGCLDTFAGGPLRSSTSVRAHTHLGAQVSTLISSTKRHSTTMPRNDPHSSESSCMKKVVSDIGSPRTPTSTRTKRPTMKHTSFGATRCASGSMIPANATF